ncbi:hypothetical protein [Actinoplanes ianthinogenes]|uniref:hypothetical protein n=1 Tax=Actinoplanes ianthinogenes TaxID=122358 RepID=UPI001670D3BA|nr:hypothetical protein [Actinoplanes ianthinogenes]
MSVAASAKRALVGNGNPLGALLPGVIVAYSAPRDLPREVVYGGQVVGPVELLSMAGGGRVKRREDLSLLLHVRVYQPGQETAETAEARAVEIGDVICIYIATNTKLTGDIEDLRLAHVTGMDLDSWTDDDGAGSILTISVGLMSNLN